MNRQGSSAVCTNHTPPPVSLRPPPRVDTANDSRLPPLRNTANTTPFNKSCIQQKTTQGGRIRHKTIFQETNRRNLPLTFKIPICLPPRGLAHFPKERDRSIQPGVQSTSCYGIGFKSRTYCLRCVPSRPSKYG